MPAEHEYRECAKLGLTKAETARRLGVSKVSVTRADQRHGPMGFRVVGNGRVGIPFKPNPELTQILERARSLGATVASVARALGVSHESVRIACRARGISLRDGRSKRTQKNRSKPNDERICDTGPYCLL